MGVTATGVNRVREPLRSISRDGDDILPQTPKEAHRRLNACSCYPREQGSRTSRHWASTPFYRLSLLDRQGQGGQRRPDSSL